MKKVLLKQLRIANLGPIQDDVLELAPFTYLVGRNNAGKSHYLRALEILLAARAPNATEAFRLQNDKSQPIVIEGQFTGVGDFTSLVKRSNHKAAIDGAIADGILTVVRVLDPRDEEQSVFGVRNQEGKIENPSGFTGNLLKVLPEPISIFATANTSDELKSKGNTALVKLKKEVLGSFFTRLREQASSAFGELDEFLHSIESGKRSAELVAFEQDLAREFEGEFADVVPAIEFELPDEEVIAQGMKILLDDGYRSDVDQKGHGLQRATLLALLRLLARKGVRYQERPAPIFLVGELETFLHPYAQRQLANALSALVDRYQILTTTHSPFIIEPAFIDGYRRVAKSADGAKNITTELDEADAETVRRHLEWRGNLEGLFADRVVVIEGSHDDGFYERLKQVFEIEGEKGQFTLFVKASGRKQLRVVRKFYKQMGLNDVSVIGDLDYVFCNDAKHLLGELEIDESYIDAFRAHIEWSGDKDPPLHEVIAAIEANGEPQLLGELLDKLRQERVFILRHGAPEFYYRHGTRRKSDWVLIGSPSDLEEGDYLKELMIDVLAPSGPTVVGSETTNDGVKPTAE